MADDTEKQRIARAKQLRKSIAEVLGKDGVEELSPPKPSNPRDAIHDYMRKHNNKHNKKR
jgi:hypothetical protein